jgi:uncharacterized protein YcbK (DUF882 family)
MRYVSVFGLGLLACLALSPVGVEAAEKQAGLNMKLRVALGRISAHYGRPVKIISGCRSRKLNRAVGGKKNSYHLRCMAADIEVAGVSPSQLVRFANKLPAIGGVGTYCGRRMVHIDVGPERSWRGGCGRSRHALRGVRKLRVARR